LGSNERIVPDALQDSECWDTEKTKVM